MKKEYIDCTYCHQKAKYSPLPELEIHNVKIFFCHICRAEYLFWTDGSLASKSLYIKINNKMYRWTEGAGTGQLWYIKTPGEPGKRINEDMENIKTFHHDKCPDIRPDNIEQKIKTILVMS